MSNVLNSKLNSSQPIVCQISIRGHLCAQRSDWFGATSIMLEDNGYTILIGPVVNQATLYGLLKKCVILAQSIV